MGGLSDELRLFIFSYGAQHGYARLSFCMEMDLSSFDVHRRMLIESSQPDARLIFGWKLGGPYEENVKLNHRARNA